MREITQTITSAKVKVNDEIVIPEYETNSTTQYNQAIKLNETIKRPETLVGSTYKIKPPISDHALYITINDILLNQDTEQESRRPFEIFVNSKNMEFYSWIVALTRVISAVFRKGGDCTFLVEELKAVFDPKGGYYQRGTGIYMPSVVADIGHVVETHLKALNMMPDSKIDSEQQAYIQQKRAAVTSSEEGYNEKEDKHTSFPSAASKCNKCYQKSVVLLDGCATCLNCGDSKCS
ncbi:TSCPD domain-containing protein [Thalassotalea profundi]|uniref:ribonucleoside-diphosphate reductase n=1 Tax=Thalassotalea profundi TaxID=2036687 RepID=A0ABQ3IFS8_9GAMM|nr:NrdJb [Thalassotalea profundi]GHE81981.1 TSCPD domain-containing protein [Thalassotalea profundi]